MSPLQRDFVGGAVVVVVIGVTLSIVGLCVRDARAQPAGVLGDRPANVGDTPKWTVLAPRVEGPGCHTFHTDSVSTLPGGVILFREAGREWMLSPPYHVFSNW